MLLFPNLLIVSPDNEQHNLEIRDFANDRLKGQLHFSCWKHCLHKFVQCYQPQWFQCIYPMHYIYNGHPSLPNCVNGTYEYIATWTSKHYVQQWTLCNVVPTIRTNGCSIFANQISCPLGYLFGHIHLRFFLTNMCAIHSMMGVCSRFEIRRLLSQLLWTPNVAEHWKGCSPHKRKLPTSCPNLVFWLKLIPRAMKHVKRFKCYL
jgi:hypothetical protein